jgi:hypothetical protein
MIRSGRSRMALNPAAVAGERDLHGRHVVDQFMRFDERLPAAVVVRFLLATDHLRDQGGPRN